MSGRSPPGERGSKYCYLGNIEITEAVALRKESVDRNKHPEPTKQTQRLSLSARRAWIEIVNTADQEARKRSLSARRAWIEISTQCKL